MSWAAYKLDPALSPVTWTSPRSLASGKSALDVRRGR